jgi:hypothetical protein
MEDLNVTRDVITDLLPIYESGEASRDTQQLVQRFLDRDPEFSRWISRLKQTRLNGKEALPAPEVELKSLIRTKTLMKQQTAVWAVAIFFTLVPFIFIFEGNRITWWLIRDAPIVGSAYLCTAVVLWIVYLVMRRRLKVL